MTVASTVIGGIPYRMYGEVMYIQYSEEKLIQMMETTMQWINSRTVGWLIFNSKATSDGNVVTGVFTELSDLNTQLGEPMQKIVLEIDFEMRHVHLSFYLL